MDSSQPKARSSTEPNPKKPNTNPPVTNTPTSPPKETKETKDGGKAEKPDPKPQDFTDPKSDGPVKDDKSPAESGKEPKTAPAEGNNKDQHPSPNKDADSPQDDKAGQSPGPKKESPVTPPASPNAETILRSRPFMVKTIRLDGAEAGTITGSILSQSLDKMMTASAHSDASALTLAGLRKLVPGMSRFVALEKFCTPSGVLVDDEAISFLEYLKIEGDSEPVSATGTPIVRLYFSPTKGGKALAPKDTPAISAPNLAEGPAVKAPDAPAASLLPKQPGITKNLIDAPAGSSGNDRPGAGMLKETEWAVVLRNCAVFYGWIIDPRTKRIVRAPKPAFQLRSKVNQEPVAKIPDYVGATTNSTDKVATIGDEEDEAPRVVKSTSLNTLTAKSELGIPNFRVNDDSRIEITAHEDELTVSMAKSDFSDQSTSVSVSGGGYGVSVGVSAGYASSESHATKNTSTTSTSTLVGRYMFPRCDILLWPDEMEPTPELAGLLDTIRRTKSIKALRKLQTEFGQLFCQQVTLGGRLLSTKIVTTTALSELEEKKESFKVSVGASVSASFGGFSASVEAKHEQSKGSASTNEQNSRSQDESVVFEAVGGDTILASDPGKWSATVGNHELWRVINRNSLSLLAEILAGMPGYAAVQSWFVQAVPALNRYMVVNDGHECKARLRITSPSNGLSVINNGNNVSYYLGHDASRSVTPQLNGVDRTTDESFWFRVTITENIPIFNPATYRAPAIFGYENFDVGKAKYGAEYNSDFVKTAWDIVAPFDDVLAHGTRIILRSCPFVDPANQPAPGDTAETPNPSHMVVFRNAQGEFLPAMSDSDEYQYWRIIKTNRAQSHVKPGDEIRLCWDFRDQSTGWRDFTEDVFGRRQNSAPPGVSGPLYLKVPWPRFENVGTPTGLIMSADPSLNSTKAVNINRKGTPMSTKYCLQDLRMRIDNLGNNGRGDVSDYTLHKVQQEQTSYNIAVEIRPPGHALQMRKSMFWFGI